MPEVLKHCDFETSHSLASYIIICHHQLVPRKKKKVQRTIMLFLFLGGTQQKAGPLFWCTSCILYYSWIHFKRFSWLVLERVTFNSDGSLMSNLKQILWFFTTLNVSVWVRVCFLFFLLYFQTQSLASELVWKIWSKAIPLNGVPFLFFPRLSLGYVLT